MAAPLRPGDSQGAHRPLEKIESKQPSKIHETHAKLTDAAREQISKSTQASHEHLTRAKLARSMIARDVKKLQKLEKQLEKASPKDFTKIDELNITIKTIKYDMELWLEAAKELLEKPGARLPEGTWSAEGEKNLRAGTKLAAEAVEFPAKSIQRQVSGLKSLFRFLFGMAHKKEDLQKLELLAAELEDYRKRYGSKMSQAAYRRAGIDVGRALWEAGKAKPPLQGNINLYMGKINDAIKSGNLIHWEALKSMVMYIQYKYPEDFEKEMKDGQFEYLDQALLEGQLINQSYIRKNL